MRRVATGIGLVLLVVVYGTGCSFLAVRGPRTVLAASSAASSAAAASSVAAASTGGGVVCDATYVAPAIDAALALAGAAIMVWGATAYSDPEGHTVTARNFAVLPGLVIGAAFGISSVYGFSKVGDCKRRAAESSGFAVGSGLSSSQATTHQR